MNQKGAYLIITSSVAAAVGVIGSLKSLEEILSRDGERLNENMNHSIFNISKFVGFNCVTWVSATEINRAINLIKMR